MIKVYFESNGCAAKIATFEDEDIYLLCLPALKKWAKANNGFITESCERSRQYWSDLKKRLMKEGYSELYEKIVQLKMVANDGKLVDAKSFWENF